MSLIVQVLEKYMEQARKGKLKHIAVCAIPTTGEFSHHDFLGEIPAEKENHEAVLKMAARMQESIDNWVMPEPDPSLDESYACYHCGNNPAGFDFVAWLVTQEMVRVKAGAPGPLKVAFWLGKNPMPCHWVDNVYRPALAMIGGVEDNRALGRLGTNHFCLRDVVKMHKEGVAVPHYKPPKCLGLPSGVITITLRETEYWPHRNSDIPAWLKFAKELRAKGERVVFVRDTRMAVEPIEDFEICPHASLDLNARMWVYSNAKMNFFVSNGPCELVKFSDKPFICFTPPEAEFSEYKPNKPSFWKEMHGVEVGQQFPWSRPNQRIVWERDTYEAIVRAYKQVSQE